MRPQYFENVRRSAAARWDQLERDPDLAAPWHQLFRQVQSPRHVLSELLQNADDACATEATVRIENGAFVFEHNGEDFTEEHFQSLCRFGYSNKRALHTIGFRGIGFKSTFSLGNTVELYTPTLAVSFDKRRFTEPAWVSDDVTTEGTTRVRVRIADALRQQELEKNLEEWVTSPVSLLFFHRIRRMIVGDHDVHWGSMGAGPIPDSEWMALHENPDDVHLVLRSPVEPFPEAALKEIAEERTLSADESIDFPPCRVELVLGARGRLYVVLPTGVATNLPFACNAPFIQDPARVRIRGPEVSPTNRWLLDRIGRFAGSAMTSWLGQQGLPIAERVPAYGFLPYRDAETSPLERACAAVVEEGFARAVEHRPVLITTAGDVVRARDGVKVPGELLDVWSAPEVSALLDSQRRPLLSREISESESDRLVQWRLVDEVSKSALLNALQAKHPPQPTWPRLLRLWSYLAPELAGYSRASYATALRIVPVQGKDVLYSAEETVRLGEKKLLQSADDWEFLARYLLVMNQNWGRFLAEARRNAEAEEDAPGLDAVHTAYRILERIGFGDASDASRIIDSVAALFFGGDLPDLEHAVRLAQIAARLEARAGGSFRFITRDGEPRAVFEQLLFDVDGGLEPLVPQKNRDARLLHSAYSGEFISCSREEWMEWVDSGRAGVLTFAPIVEKRTDLYNRKRVEQVARSRAQKAELSFHYRTHHFQLEDWDFDIAWWQHWRAIAPIHEDLWAEIGERIVAQREAYWTTARTARLLHVATTGSVKSMTDESLLPQWVVKLRDEACLRDTRRVARKPADLMRRTPETEPFLDIEPFIDARLDTERSRALLDLLGVQSVPVGVSHLLDRLRALSRSDDPPMHEVEKWCRRLDQVAANCPTTELQLIARGFAEERLIRSADDDWGNSFTVFLSSDEDDAPGAAIVHALLRDLSLWRRVGVAERPTAQLALEWLRGLPSGEALRAEDLRRVRSLLARHPVRVWNECGHWLSLAGEWAPAGTLAWSLTMQALVPWAHLFLSIKQRTADLQKIPVDVTGSPPFNHLLPLAQQLEERLDREMVRPGAPEEREWLAAVGSELRHVVLESEAETARVRALSKRLAATRWVLARELQSVPYIDGTPAGTSRKADVIWTGDVLYVKDLPNGRLARLVPEELGKTFARDDVRAALYYAFDRSSDDVKRYCRQNFEIVEVRTGQVPTSRDSQSQGSPKGGIDEPGDWGEAISDQDRTAQDPPFGADMHAVTHLEPVVDAAGQRTTVVGELPQQDEPHEVDGTDAVELSTVVHGPQQQEEPHAEGPIAPKSAKLRIIERFAVAHGFAANGSDRFGRPDGSTLARSADIRSLWEWTDPHGEAMRGYLVSEQSLKRGAVEVDAAAWAALEQSPQHYALVTTDVDGQPLEIAGDRLLVMCQSGEVQVHPAAYRLIQSQT